MRCKLGHRVDNSCARGSARRCSSAQFERGVSAGGRLNGLKLKTTNARLATGSTPKKG